MLIEPSKVPRRDGALVRRWFTDEDFDLYVWLDGAGDMVCFELCYDVARDQHVLRWRRGVGYAHHRVDEGSGPPGRARASVMLEGGANLVVLQEVITTFQRARGVLEQHLFTDIYHRLTQYRPPRTDSACDVYVASSMSSSGSTP